MLRFYYITSHFPYSLLLLIDTTPQRGTNSAVITPSPLERWFTGSIARVYESQLVLKSKKETQVMNQLLTPLPRSSIDSLAMLQTVSISLSWVIHSLAVFPRNLPMIRDQPIYFKSYTDMFGIQQGSLLSRTTAREFNRRLLSWLGTI